MAENRLTLAEMLIQPEPRYVGSVSSFETTSSSTASSSSSTASSSTTTSSSSSTATSSTASSSTATSSTATSSTTRSSSRSHDRGGIKTSLGEALHAFFVLNTREWYDVWMSVDSESLDENFIDHYTYIKSLIDPVIGEMFDIKLELIETIVSNHRLLEIVRRFIPLYFLNNMSAIINARNSDTICDAIMKVTAEALNLSMLYISMVMRLFVEYGINTTLTTRTYLLYIEGDTCDNQTQKTVHYMDYKSLMISNPRYQQLISSVESTCALDLPDDLDNIGNWLMSSIGSAFCADILCHH